MTKSDGLRCPLDERDFAHWIAKHGAMPVGARPEDYIVSQAIAWAAYKRGRSDQRKIENTKAKKKGVK